jgi:eukaryotic-like serine/threonine-protein kinase
VTHDHDRKVPMIGQTISHYKITEKLGEGGMGVVYKAEDTNLDRTVALKFLAAHLLGSEEHKLRLLREAKATALLDHPNICMMHEVGEADGQVFLAMGYIDGPEVSAKIKERPLKLDETFDIAIQAAEGLRAAHQKGIVHRDIKSSNLMLTSAGQVKIMDFGLAQLTGGTRLTKTDTIMGTPAYMSPEQALGQTTDRRTDIWSLGVVLYEMVTGRLPFEAEWEQAMVYSIINEPHEPVTAVRANVPLELDRILNKALAKRPAERYQHLDDMLVDLRALRRDTSSVRVTTAAKPGATRGIAKRWKIVAPAAAAALASLVAGYFYFQRTPTLTDKDTIVLADFSNTTGDPVFDGTLRQGLAIQLAQSPFLSLVSEMRIQQVLRLMGQPPDARLTPEIARELCQRTGGAAVLDGSIASLGSQYVLGLRAEDCRTGDVLAEEQAQAARKEDVLNALSQIASKFRTRVGESLATVEEHDTPLAEATTPSLEALKAFSVALKAARSADSSAALPLLKRAVELDPDFALAHAFLGLIYSGMGESDLSVETTTKAYQLRDRTSDHERFFITVTYHRQVTGNLEKAQQAGELWAQTYPRDSTAHGLLSGFTSQGAGQYENSIEEAQKAITLDPDSRPPYINLAFSYAYLNRFEEAESTMQRVAEGNQRIPEFLVLRYYLSFFKRDSAGMERAAAQAKGKPGVEEWMSHSESLVLARSGRLQRAREMSRRAVELPKRAGERERAALYQAGAAVWEAFFGNASVARQSATEALQLSKGRDVEYGAAFALALTGDSSQAQRLADDLEKRFPEDTSIRFNYLPALRARLALNHGDPGQAIEQLQAALPYELAVPGVAFNGFYGGLYPAYVRGEAFLAAHQGAEAAAEFQKVLDHPGIVFGDPIGALAHLQLGRAFALSGEKTKARTAYQGFLTLWKDADPAIPILEQAKAEYAKLQ